MNKNTLSFFIVGLPRSGTKLLRELLNNHSQIFIPSVEAYFIPHLVRKYGNKILESHEVSAVIDEIRSSLFFFYYHPKKQFSFDSVKKSDLTVHELVANIFQEIAVSQKGEAVPVLGDKTPRNIKHIQFLLSSFPKCKIIHIVRDPRDNVLSARNKWGKNMYRSAYKWQQGINMTDTINEGRERFIEIRYEDLLKNTESVLKKLCSFIGVEYESGMDRLNVIVEGKGGKIDKENFGKFSKYLDKNEIKYIERLTKKGLQKYNYKIHFKNLTPIEKPLFLNLYWWKLQDIIHLILHDLQKHGFKRGIEKLIKARRHA